MIRVHVQPAALAWVLACHGVHWMGGCSGLCRGECRRWCGCCSAADVVMMQPSPLRLMRVQVQASREWVPRQGMRWIAAISCMSQMQVVHADAASAL